MSDKAVNPLRVLIVDDEVSIADSLTEILRLRGHHAHSAYSGLSALESLSMSRPQILIADVFMAGMNGIELANHVADRDPACRIILFSGQADMIHTLSRPDLQSHRYTLYHKPIHPEALIELIEGEGARRRRETIPDGSRSGNLAQTETRDSEPGPETALRLSKPTK